VASLSENVALFLPNEKATERFFDFFTSTISQQHTRRAYYKAAARFSEWCEGRGLLDLAHVKPLHVALAISNGSRLPEPKGQGPCQALGEAALWRRCGCCLTGLVVGHVMETNPAHSVRGPKHVVRKGRHPVLNREEAQALLAIIDTGSLTACATARLSAR